MGLFLGFIFYFWVYLRKSRFCGVFCFVSQPVLGKTASQLTDFFSFLFRVIFETLGLKRPFGVYFLAFLGFLNLRNGERP